MHFLVFGLIDLKPGVEDGSGEGSFSVTYRQVASLTGEIRGSDGVKMQNAKIAK
jgi:hypothetical protein